MYCWYYDKNALKNTPSVRDGIAVDTERRYRKEGARFIMTCGTEMGLGHNTIATGIVYFHRFYIFHSFKTFPRYVTACCCLFLAGKVEETPKKCRDIIKTARCRLTDIQFYSFGDDPKEEVMMLERILLQTIKFDLQVEHPYSYLLKYAKSLKGDQVKLQKMVQMAWNFVNDSLSTVVCLQWEPEIVAVALIHLASKLSKFSVIDWIGRQLHQNRWWEMFVSNVTTEILEDICHQVLDLYQSNQQEQPVTPASPPQEPPSRVESPPRVKGSFTYPGTGVVATVPSRQRSSVKSFSSGTKSLHDPSVNAPIARSVGIAVPPVSSFVKENVALYSRTSIATVYRQLPIPHGNNNLYQDMSAYSRMPSASFSQPYMAAGPYIAPPRLQSSRGLVEPKPPALSSKPPSHHPWNAQFPVSAPPRMPPMPPPRTAPSAIAPRQHSRSSNQSGRMPALRTKYYYQPYSGRQSRY